MEHIIWEKNKTKQNRNCEAQWIMKIFQTVQCWDVFVTHYLIWMHFSLLTEKVKEKIVGEKKNLASVWVIYFDNFILLLLFLKKKSHLRFLKCCLFLLYVQDSLAFVTGGFFCPRERGNLKPFDSYSSIWTRLVFMHHTDFIQQNTLFHRPSTQR